MKSLDRLTREHDENDCFRAQFAGIPLISAGRVDGSRLDRVEFLVSRIWIDRPPQRSGPHPTLQWDSSARTLAGTCPHRLSPRQARCNLARRRYPARSLDRRCLGPRVKRSVPVELGRESRGTCVTACHLFASCCGTWITLLL